MEFKLILKKLNNTLSEKEDVIFSEWYNDSDLHKEFFEKVKQSYQDENLLVDVKKGWESIEKRIKPVVKKKTNYLKYAVAASILLLVSINILIKKSNTNAITPIVTKNIKAGTDKAILTLADGSQILLDSANTYHDQEITSNGKDVIYNKTRSKSKKLEYNYLTIPRGGQYHVILSDSTEIWLNSESKLKYPVNFIKGNSREIELVYGEAYFDVSESTKHDGAKFLVKTGNQEIEVLGTEFNVKAYQDESTTSTTLVEGKVTLHIENKTYPLLPKYKAVLNQDTNVVNIAETNIYSETSWKDGIFTFRNKSLKEIMKTLSRWYDINVVFENPQLENKKFKGTLVKDQDIEDILLTLKSSGSLKFYDIKQDTIILK